MDQLQKFKFELLVMVVEQTTTEIALQKLSAPDAIFKTTNRTTKAICVGMFVKTLALHCE